MDYTFVEEALLEGNLSSLKHVKIKDLEDTCEYFGWKILATDSFIKKKQDAHEQQEDVQKAKKELSEYQTILSNAQELLTQLRVQKKEKSKKKNNRKKEYDWEDEERNEFWEDEEPESEFQEDSEYDFPSC